MTPPLPEAATPLSRRMTGSVRALVGQYGALTVLSAIATIAITRLLGPGGYGVYGSAVATSLVLGALADFGFGVMLSRDMTASGSGHRAMLRAAYQVAGVWSALLALAMVAMAVAAPLSSPRGLALLVLAPSMAFNGLNPARILFLVRYRTRRLVAIDIVTATAQLGGAVVVASLGLGPVAVAGVVSVASIVNNISVAIAADRMLPHDRVEAFSRRELVRRSVPLGLISVMTRVYVTIDVVLLGWYISGPRLGEYAAASKVLAVLAGATGAVMGGALPALSSPPRGSPELRRLAERLWRWLFVGALPVFVALGLFAPVIVHLGFGARFDGAAALLRILSIAGAVAVPCTLAGNVMIALRMNRALFVQNALAIAFNVTANVILIPRYGVYAAAWVTVVTELLVCSAAFISLRHELSPISLLRALRIREPADQRRIRARADQNQLVRRVSGTAVERRG